MSELLDRMAQIELRNEILTEASEKWKKKYEELDVKYKILEDKLKAYENQTNKK